MSTNKKSQKEQAAIQNHIKNLQNSNPRQRSGAAEELGRLHAEEAASHLIELLHEDVNTYVRSACAEALGQISTPDAIFPLMDALHDSCSFVRRAAAISLGQMSAKEAQGALLNALEDHNFYVRRAAINAIGKLGIPDMGPILLPFLDTSDPRIRRTTITALQRLHTQEAIPQMTTMLEEYMDAPHQRDIPTVKTLVVALGKLKAKAAVPILIRVVRGYVGVRSLAAKALGKIGDPQAGPVLQAALEDRSANLRLAALKSLGRLKYRPAAPTVHKFLSSPDPRMRRTATLAIGYLEDATAVNQLLSIAREDGSSLVRPAAVQALGRVGNETIISELLPLVEDTNAYLRAALAETLTALAIDGEEPAVRAALKQLAEDQVEHVAKVARSALIALDHRDYAEVDINPTGREVLSEEPAIAAAATSWLRRVLRRG